VTPLPFMNLLSAPFAPRSTFRGAGRKRSDATECAAQIAAQPDPTPRPSRQQARAADRAEMKRKRRTLKELATKDRTAGGAAIIREVRL
jgi:hypothetical protein